MIWDGLSGGRQAEEQSAVAGQAKQMVMSLREGGARLEAAGL